MTRETSTVFLWFFVFFVVAVVSWIGLSSIFSTFSVLKSNMPYQYAVGVTAVFPFTLLAVVILFLILKLRE